VGSTSHLQNLLLQTIRALASTIKIHINLQATQLQRKNGKKHFGKVFTISVSVIYLGVSF
jgi:hypothetical protein